MKRLTLLTASALIAAALAAAPPGLRVTYVRYRPAKLNLGTPRTIVIGEISGDIKPAIFVAAATEEIARAGYHRLTSAIDRKRTLRDIQERPAIREALRKQYGGEIGAAVQAEDCEIRQTSVDIRTRPQGEEQTGIVYRARCSAQITLIDLPSGIVVASIPLQVVASSQRSPSPDPARETEVREEASRKLAEEFVERITPKRVHESIRLDREAPSLENARTLLADAKYDSVAALWKRALSQNPRSAPLLYNLGAVSEALGRLDEAERYYAEAAKLDSANDVYVRALEQLENRKADEIALAGQ